MTASDDLTRTAEDLAVQKGVTPTTISQGQISTWSLRVRSSEYRRFSDVRIEDTVPDGLCPLGASNFENPVQRSAECDPVAGTDPPCPTPP